MNILLDEGKRIVRYNPSLVESLCCADFINPQGPSLLIDDSGQRYGPSGAIKIPSWREIIPGLISDDFDPRNIKFDLTNSYAVQARKAAYKLNTENAKIEFPIIPCTVIGIPKTLDEKILCGIRGSELGSGKADIPGGYLTVNENGRNPIFSSYYGELKEETGIEDREIKRNLLVGHFKDNEFNTLCFIMFTELNVESKEIIERHRRAFEVYSKAKASGLGEVTSRKEISKDGHLVVDAWEHHTLFALPYERNVLRKIIGSGEIAYGERKHECLQNMAAAFRIIQEDPNFIL